MSVGARIAALIINQLTDRKALYKLKVFYKRQDVELLFAPGITAGDFYDDALVRALDTIHSGRVLKKFISRQSKGFVTIPNLTLDRLHFDTISLVFTRRTKEEEDILKIVREYSKEHTPDLAQFKMGMGTQHKGSRFTQKTLDGDLDDKKWLPRSA